MKVIETKDQYVQYKNTKLENELKVRSRAMEAFESGYTSEERWKQIINSLGKLPHFDWQSHKINPPSEYRVKVIPRNKIISFYLKALFYKYINKFYLNK